MLKLAGFIHAGPVALCLYLTSLGGLHAATTGTLTLPATIQAAAPGDDQERMTNGALNPQAEKASRTAALYADSMAHDASGDHQGAVTELRQVVALDPHFVDAQVKLSMLLSQSKSPDALAQAEAAVKANPQSVAIEGILAEVQFKLGHREEARRLTEDILSKDPNQLAAMQVLLELGADQHALEPAVKRATDFLKLSNAPVESYLALVKIYLDLTGKEDPQPDGVTIQNALLPVYQQALEKGPATVDLLSVLSDTYHDLGKKDEALHTLDQALALQPTNMEVMMRCATLASELGDHKKELAYYEKAYATDPNEDGLREDLVRAYYENELFAKALALMKKMLTNSPDDSMLEMRIGVTCEGLHQPAQAKMWFEKALTSSACPLDAYIKMGAYYLDMGRVPEARHALALAVKRFPDNAQIRFYQAVQNQDARNYPEALKCLDETKRLSGGDPSAMGVNFYLVSAAVLSGAGHRDQIEPMLKEGLEKFPDDPNLLNQQAWEWADEGTNLLQALKTAQHAATLAPDNGSMQDTIGWVYFKMGKLNEALPVLQRAANMTNNDPSVLQHLGDAYLGWVVNRKH